MTDGTTFRDVQLRGFPVQVHARAEERHEELLREFSHIANARSDAHIPQRLLALVAQARSRYGGLTGPARAAILTARDAGTAAIDVSYRVPVDAAEAAQRFLDGLEEADEFCRSGDLLTLAATPELVRFRRWFFGEFLRQLHGEAPTPWPGGEDGAAAAAAEHEPR